MKQYELKDYIKILEDNHLIKSKNISESIFHKKISNVSYNSKDIGENSIFICKGNKFKEEYLTEAINRGIILYVSEIEYLDYPHIIVTDIRKSLALLSKLYFNNPEEPMNLIGITGTKGKSTTAFFTKSILDEYLGDTAILSSILNYDGTSHEALVTTPESFEIYKYMHEAQKNNIKTMVMEVSSQALKYDRVYKIPYKVGVFTNISTDHISPIEHPNFEDYFHSKLSLFKNCNTICINLDSDFIEKILEEARDHKVITYSLKNKNADIYGYDIKKIDHSTFSFKVKTKNFDKEFTLPMGGIFNIYNALASIAISVSLDVPVGYMIKGLAKVSVPGRMKTITSKDNKTIAIVDYAHNKLSFEALLSSIRKEYPDKKIITVFGSVGDKAKNRRKELGIIASNYADFSYLTTDDPGSEEAQDICHEIAKYIDNDRYKIVLNRESAIKEAILNNRESVIVIAGKGAEVHQKCKTLEDYKGDIFCATEALKEIEELTLV